MLKRCNNSVFLWALQSQESFHCSNIFIRKSLTDILVYVMYCNRTFIFRSLKVHVSTVRLPLSWTMWCKMLLRSNMQNKSQKSEIRGVSMVWKRGIVGWFLKLVGVGAWVLKVQQTKACSTGLRVPFSEFLFNIRKSFSFWKVTTLEIVLISYCWTLWDIIIFYGDPTIHP